jgi:hypothetical protein
LCDGEAWSLAIREEQTKKASENTVMSIFGLQGKKVKGGWRKIHNERLPNFSSPNIISVIN